MNVTNLILIKDFKSEIKTKISINTQLLFILTILSIILFSISDEDVSTKYAISFYWIVSVFAAMSGLSRIFIKEEERKTELFLFQLANYSSVFLGKLFFNIIFTLLINVIIMFLFTIFFDLFKINSLFFFVIVFGSIGIASVSTIVAAIISKVNSSTTLYTVLSFPILLPILMITIQASQLACEFPFFNEMKPYLLFLISYNVAIILSSVFLFKYIWGN